MTLIRYDLVVAGACDGFPAALSAAGLAVPGQVMPSSAGLARVPERQIRPGGQQLVIAYRRHFAWRPLRQVTSVRPAAPPSGPGPG